MTGNSSMDERVRIVELIPGHYFETWHKEDCSIWGMPDSQPWCSCNGYIAGKIKEVERPTDSATMDVQIRHQWLLEPRDGRCVLWCAFVRGDDHHWFYEEYAEDDRLPVGFVERASVALKAAIGNK